MSNARTFSRNLAANWLAQIANMVVLFFLSPWIVNTLGPVDYGIWTLLNVLTGYMGILDLGIRASTGRHIMLYVGREDDAAVNETVRTSLAYFTLLGLLFLTVSLCFAWAFPHVFSSVPNEYHSMLLLLLPLMGLNAWISAVAAIFSSVLAAHERFDLARTVDLVTLSARTTATVVVLSMGYGVLGLAVVVAGASLIPLLWNILIAGRLQPSLKYWPPRIDKSRGMELFNYGIFAFITAVSVKLIGQADLLIVGTTLGVPSVAVYSVGAMLVYYSQTFFSQISRTIFPSVQKVVARGEIGNARWLFFRQNTLAMVFRIPTYIGFICFCEPFIRLWMLGPKFGPDSVDAAAAVMGLLAGSKLLLLFTSGANPILEAFGRVRFTAMLAIAEAIVNVGLSFYFVLGLGMGLSGVALGTLVARFFLNTLVVPWYACHYVGIRPSVFLARVGGTSLVASLLFAAWCVAVRSVLPADTWPTFFASVVVSLTGYIPILLYVILSADDRRRVFHKLRLVRLAPS